jgi:hypothetical protein
VKCHKKLLESVMTVELLAWKAYRITFMDPLARKAGSELILRQQDDAAFGRLIFRET